MRSYYRDSLTMLRAELRQRRKRAAARQARMVKAHHPDAADQQLLVNLFDDMLDLIDAARARMADPL